MNSEQGVWSVIPLSDRCVIIVVAGIPMTNANNQFNLYREKTIFIYSTIPYLCFEC